MSIVQDVSRAWKGLSRSLQRWVMNEAMRGEDAGWRMRCKVIRNLVRGESPTQIHRILGCARSHVYDVAAKFVTYALYPEQAYSVLLTRSPKKCKISLGFNPWCGQTRTHDIAKMCERYGGGGHPVVGAISLGADQLAKAKEIASTLADELSVR